MCTGETSLPFCRRCRCGCFPESVRARWRAHVSELNIAVVRELATVAVEHLTLAFGRLGLILHQRALGIDDTPVYPPVAVPSIEQEKLFSEDTNDLALLKRWVGELCERTASRLRSSRLRAGRVELRVRYSDYREDIGRERLQSPSRSAAAIEARADPLLERVVSRRTRVRSLCLRLTELTGGPAQLELFADPRTERRLKLESALDTLRARSIQVGFTN